MNSRSENMKVFFTSNPTAMMSLQLFLEKPRTSAMLRFDLNRNFSSSVNMMTKGTSKTSCSHLIEDGVSFLVRG